MDVQTLNEVGITLAGILGMALFYWIGKKNAQKRSKQRRDPAGNPEENSGPQEKK